jgi:signal transduction histidine kinase
VFSAVVIVVFGLLLFRRNLLVPLRRISVATEAIAGGQFDTPVPGDAPAELASLADSLTTMGTALSAYRTRTADQIAALGRTNAELALAQDALVRTEKLAGVGRLAAGLAHEFGNPLAAVRGYLELLAANPGSPDAADIASRAHVETERMHRLLRNLLDYARADEAEPGNVNLVELLDEAARTVRHQVTFRNRDVTVKITEVPAVRGEAPKLHQVLVNLLLNAADAGAGRIQLSAVGEGRQVVVQVADDGEGIPTANLPKLFEPFFTTRPPGHGTGLGLAIAHRIVEQHGGTIEVKSSPGVGTVFTIRLPVAR